MRHCNACGRPIPEHTDERAGKRLWRFCPIKRAPRLKRHPRKGTPYTDPPPRYAYDAGAAA